MKFLISPIVFFFFFVIQLNLYSVTGFFIVQASNFFVLNWVIQLTALVTGAVCSEFLVILERLCLGIIWDPQYN